MSVVIVTGLPSWMPRDRLLDDGDWRTEALSDGTITATGERDPRAAADLSARLRGLGFGGRALDVQIEPPLPRALVRAARTEDARRRRDTTPGFTRAGVQLDEEGRISLTPEALALSLGQRARGLRVVDLGCGCGGNAIGFARGGAAEVIAIEPVAERLEMARHNATVYGVSVRFVHGDDGWLDSLDGDVLFVDPPWGVAYDRVRTTPAAFPLLARALAAPQFDAVWAKLPPSFDATGLDRAVIEPFFGEADGDRRRVKFVLVRCSLRP